MPSKRSLALVLSVGLISAATVTNVHAVVFNEIGDAGQTLGTAQATTGNPLDGINGTFSSSTDVDLFRIYISSPSTFSATATTVGGNNLDTALFLFTLSGTAILANDDGSGTSIQARLPAGNSVLSGLAPGFYYLGIALSGNEPVNSVNQFLFNVGNASTDLRTAASGVNPTTLFNWNGNTTVLENGAYGIGLTGASSIPEPSVLALAGVGTALLGARFVRRNRVSRATRP